ncbi:hypothetical protein ZWY2020_045854 [Hordeum vulgare]|nr:hypothetical protein ZWY2020_045854 [Hordeum vulgare]
MAAPAPVPAQLRRIFGLFANQCVHSNAEHRHVGSTNFNLPSSRSHTSFTLNLIDLAGSESSRAETIGRATTLHFLPASESNQTSKNILLRLNG